MPTRGDSGLGRGSAWVDGVTPQTNFIYTLSCLDDLEQIRLDLTALIDGWHDATAKPKPFDRALARAPLAAAPRYMSPEHRQRSRRPHQRGQGGR
jgi:hypothetical protein